ncbi:hypothetical protein RsTz2092_03990 [Deferribacterales bacterium RsTz2092]|nr:hypothetical protein AGMMS49941_02840 [Deferribacterales bacterium]
MARIKSSVIDEVRGLNILDIIKPHVKLTEAGGRYKACCPFHAERTPSFFVNPEHHSYKCFGCGEAGSGITFIMKYLNLSFTDAVAYLCEHYGIELLYDERDRPSRPVQDIKTLHSAVLDYSVKQLFGERGKFALDYIYERGFDKSTIDKFLLGFIPPNVDMTPFKNNFSEEVLRESGIFIKGANGWYCHFAGRILFPIHSATGACIAFSGRSMNPNDKAKYKNSPETPIFSKRRELFNLHNAKDVMKKSERCFIVEGYFDAIRMVSAGYGETVAIMGTAFTAQQVVQLKRYVQEYNIILDGDEAGQKAMRDSLKVALETDIYPNVIFLPEGDDPDTFIKNNGRTQFDSLIAEKQDLLSYTIRCEYSLATDDNKRFNRLERIKEAVSAVRNPYRRERYIDETSQVFNVSKALFSEDISPVRQKLRTAGQHNALRQLAEEQYLASVLRLMDEQLYTVLDGVSEAYFDDERLRNIFKKVLDLYQQDDNISGIVGDSVFGDDVASLLAYELPASPHECAERGKNNLQLKYYEKLRLADIKAIAVAQSEDEKNRLSSEAQELLKKVMDLRKRYINGE